MLRALNGYGWVEVICGCMFSGKTEELIRRLQRVHYARICFQVFKPSVDNRYSKDCVASHNATHLSSISIGHSEEIFNHLQDQTRVVGIDEVQFFDQGIIDVVERLASRGIRVIIAGLDLDYRGRPFGSMPELLAIAEKITKLSAICVVCGEEATRTYRVTSSDEQVLVGASNHYQARCRRHHVYEKNHEVTKVSSRKTNKKFESQSEVAL